MNPDIRTIFFDVGNTLRIVQKDQAFIDAAEAGLMELIQTNETHDALFAKLEQRWNDYRRLSKSTLLDVSEGELWSQFLLPDYEPNSIYANAPRLTRLWRDHDGRRVARPDAVDTIQELCRRGYTLGIIANTVTETEIPDWIADAGLAACFKTVILSSKVRLRKPDPEIYHLACRCIGTPEGACAYVGDNPVRDVEGTQAAGFGMMIRIDEPDTLNMEKATGKEFTPDHVITRLSELLDLFPAR
ncbi:HAD family hydrolase [Dysosmobacter sp.]